jgi:hypothetical protein
MILKVYFDYCLELPILVRFWSYTNHSWKKLHAACADISFRIEDILVQISGTNVAILDFCCGFD